MAWLVAVLLFLGGTDAVDPSFLNQKVMAGYQGWFEADGSWRHWSDNGKAPAPQVAGDNKTHLTFDLWPDTREYSQLYPTGLHMADGSPAQLFSAQDSSTMDLHAKWAADYGIDGFFLQRFVSELTDPTMVVIRNNVLKNMQTAAEQHGRSFAVMYDLSGAPEDTLYDVITQDWQWIVSQGVTESPMYQHHNGRPVLCIWGWGFNDRTQDISLAKKILQFFRVTSNLTTMGGLPFHWHTGDHDSQPGWDTLYNSPNLDIISPWAVGRFGSTADYDNLFSTVVSADMAAIKGKQDYAPVVWPGFSWANLQSSADKYNQIPRNCGEFFTHQASKLVGSGEPLFIYVAMFDEVNEGTAIFKATSANASLPTDARFTYLDLDACGQVPEDHYLTLAGQFYSESTSD